MDGSEVALASIALAGTAIAGVIYVVKYLANTLSKNLEENTKAYVASTSVFKELEKTVAKVGRQAELSARNSEEQLTFMKKLNGKLESAVLQKVTDQTVVHQTVEHQEVQS